MSIDPLEIPDWLRAQPQPQPLPQPPKDYAEPERMADLRRQPTPRLPLARRFLRWLRSDARP